MGWYWSQILSKGRPFAMAKLHLVRDDEGELTYTRCGMRMVRARMERSGIAEKCSKCRIAKP
jgi:hypothetical protein